MRMITSLNWAILEELQEIQSKTTNEQHLKEIEYALTLFEAVVSLAQYDDESYRQAKKDFYLYIATKGDNWYE